MKSHSFFDGFRGDRTAWEVTDLEVRLAQALDRAREAWPDLALSDEDFLRYLGARIDPAMGGAPLVLARLHLDDLYLACACALGVRGAVEAFFQRHLQQVPRYLARLNATATLVEETQQELGQRLLVAEAPGAARISTYNGQGPLEAWVAVSAQRTALNLLARRSESRVQPLGEALERRLAESANPELLLTRAHLRADFRAAIHHAVGALSVRDRTLLRLSIIGGVGCRKLAEMYGVNFATASRWLVKVRGSLLAGVQTFLKDERGIDPGELTSVLGVTRSQIDLSLSGLLAENEGVGATP